MPVLNFLKIFKIFIVIIVITTMTTMQRRGHREGPFTSSTLPWCIRTNSPAPRNLPGSTGQIKAVLEGGTSHPREASNRATWST